MTSIVFTNYINTDQHLLMRPKAEQPLTRGKEITKSGFLRNDRPPRRQIAYATVAEPATARLYIAAFGDAKLRFRALDELSVTGGGACHLGRIKQVPAVMRESLQILNLSRMNVEGECELLSS